MIKAPTRRSQSYVRKTMETVDALLEEYKVLKNGKLKATRKLIWIRVLGIRWKMKRPKKNEES